ncbi:ATP-binding protein [Micromonospora sp. WMMD1102]|uniref:DEAD/DEAH box helicase n=1 Tax=Micromonospora sp. WMMD1102 TaxID=3016105 RepID=UPI0024150DBF|nr:ATP-binding protein [Micromonospora sp. WMMD1102]MDG4788773.1 ATP-binding protein [Micromonospora sp. WMMD1102]
MSPSVATVLRALADLAPAAPERVYDVTRPGQPLIWLPDPNFCRRSREVERLVAADLLHRDDRTLRRGWGLVAGVAETAAGPRKVRFPLLGEPVRLEPTLRGYRVVPAGDFEITPLVEDRDLAAQLEVALELGGLPWLAGAGAETWMRTAAEATGLRVGEVDRGRRTGRASFPSRPPVLYVSAVLFGVRDVAGLALGDRLRAWAARPGLESTALAPVYGTAAPAEPAVDSGPVDSPLPLNEAQTEVVRRVRHQPVTVVSGPPGNGKSHAVVAAALDVVDRGGSVLVVTQSTHAADVLGELLERYPGPRPVLFGDAERRAALAAALEPAAEPEVTAATLAADRAALAGATAEVARLTDQLTGLLDLELLAGEVPRWAAVVGGLRLDVPGAFAPGADLAAAGRAVERARASAGRWWRRWLPGPPGRRLRRRLGAARTVPLDRLGEAVAAARSEVAAARLAALGGADPGPLWPLLAQARARLSTVLGTAMRHRGRGPDRWDDAARRTAVALGGALRAGRNRRRELLAELPGPALVRALPLWIGTVTDVEELLPPVAGLFDLVILDEASHTDQIRAAPALARARRALVVGDPRQLRFVSFVADVDVAATLSRYGLDNRVDVRRVSTFDLAAGAAPVSWLDEHYRCAPHLIEFSAHRFYAGRIAVATRHPGNETADVIDVRTVPAAVTEAGVNRAEVAAAVAEVRRLAEAGRVGIGVITPFRAQADALESALVAEFPVAEIERLGLRVGTVHSFQGSEAETVLVSLAVTDPVPAGRLRFLTDPNLFNVMVTRARRRMVVLTSLSAPNGLLGDYLRYAALPPDPRGEPVTVPAAPGRNGRPDVGVARGGATDAVVGRGGAAAALVGDPLPVDWAGELAAELVRVGLPVRRRYPVGRWTVDLCVGTGASAVGLNCVAHPDGAAAHIARHRALVAAGWVVVDAFASRWGGDPVRAALEVAARWPELT